MSNAYLRINHSTITKPSTAIPLAIGGVGIMLLLMGLANIADNGIGMLVIGGICSLALIPGLYQSGIELDKGARRFREFSGSLGKTKGVWIDVEDGDYLSVVGISESRTANIRTGGASRIVGMSKIYFFSGDWHIELYKGDYENAITMARRIAQLFTIDVNDVNQNQRPASGQAGMKAYGGESPF